MVKFTESTKENHPKQYYFKPNRIIMSLMNEKKVLNFYKLNGLLNWGMYLVLNELENKNTDFKIFNKLTKEELKHQIDYDEKKNFIIHKRKLEMRKAYIYINFESTLIRFIKLNVDIENAISVLEQYLEEAELLDMTKKIKKMKRIINYLKEKKSYNLLAEFMKFKIIYTKENTKDKEMII